MSEERSGGRKARRKGKSAAESSTPSREEQEKLMEAAVEKEMRRVHQMGQESDAHLWRVSKALMDASMRSMLMQKKEYSVATLPRFQISVNCTAKDLRRFYDERRFRFQLVTSLQLIDGKIVATPSMTYMTYQLIEVMDANNKSIMQFAFSEHDGYMVGFRPTPTPLADAYKPDGLFVFGDMKNPLPAYFGKSYIMEHHTESYTDTSKVQLRPGFVQFMVENLQEHFTIDNYMLKIDKRVRYLEAPMVLFGECQRSMEVRDLVLGPEDDPFGLITAPVDGLYDAVEVFITAAMDTLFHNWSALSKVGLAFYIAILELDMGLEKQAMDSFIDARVLMRKTVKKMSQIGDKKVDVVLTDADGIFRLKLLLGKYVALVKYEEAAVARCIIRKRFGFKAAYDRCSKASTQPSTRQNDRIKKLWDTADDEESDHEESDGEGSRAVAAADKLEWERWRSIKEAGKTLITELMK